MTTPHDTSAHTTPHMDAMEMTKHRRTPAPDTPQKRAYVRLLEEVTAFQHALVQANPKAEESDELTATLASVRERLEGAAVPEAERLYARGELSGGNMQVLMPPLTVEYVDDREFRAHTVAGEFAMGMNQAMHGGVVSVLFDTAMGRLAMGTEMLSARTAYLTTQYRNITPIGERLDLTARVDTVEGRKKFISGQLWHGDILCAEANSLFVAVKPGQQ